jgi:hypothetical protein
MSVLVEALLTPKRGKSADGAHKRLRGDETTLDFFYFLSGKVVGNLKEVFDLMLLFSISAGCEWWFRW